MTVYQSNSSAYCAYHVQSGLGTQYTSTGSKIFRQTGGAGLKPTRAQTASGEIRQDGMSSRGRLGTQKVTGAWSGEASIGSFEDIAEAVMRDTWAATLTLTQTQFTSLTTGANTIILASGNPITLGLRVGDVIRLTGLNATGNNSKNLRITALSATTITVAETLTVDAVADTSCTITRPKKLTQFSAGSLVKRYFTVEDYDVDLDQSEVATDFVWGSMKFSMAANGLLTLDVGGTGTGKYDALATGSSPLMASPTTPTGIPLSVVDATIRVNGVDVVDLTAFDLSLDTKPTAPDTFGSGAQKYSPDVFCGEMEIGMNLTALRKDLQYLTDFLAETVYSLHVLAVDNEAEPKDFFSIYLGNFTIGDVSKSALSKAGGARTHTIQVPAALVGIDDHGTAYDSTMIKFSSTGI
jgi:Phage tail tube protein